MIHVWIAEFDGVSSIFGDSPGLAPIAVTFDFLFRRGPALFHINNISHLALVGSRDARYAGHPLPQILLLTFLSLPARSLSLSLLLFVIIIPNAPHILTTVTETTCSVTQIQRPFFKIIF